MFCRVQPKTKLFRWRSHDHRGYCVVVSRCACAVRLIDYDPLGLTLSHLIQQGMGFSFFGSEISSFVGSEISSPKFFQPTLRRA